MPIRERSVIPCNGVLEMLGRNVQDAKKNIARYRALAAPQSVDLFDIYEILQKIMEGISDLGYVGDLYSADKNCGCQHT